MKTRRPVIFQQKMSDVVALHSSRHPFLPLLPSAEVRPPLNSTSLPSSRAVLRASLPLPASRAALVEPRGGGGGRHPAPTMDPENEGEGADQGIGEELLSEEINQEDAWAVITSYFEEKGLVRQQLDSFNEFAENMMQEIVDECAIIDVKPVDQHRPDVLPGEAVPSRTYRVHFGQASGGGRTERGGDRGLEAAAAKCRRRRRHRSPAPPLCLLLPVYPSPFPAVP